MSSERCAAHPGRPAVDGCPVCGRLRCGADAAAGDGCPLCTTGRAGAGPAAATALPVERPPAEELELLVRGALAAQAVGLAWGTVTAEYVGASVFEYLSPAVLGVLCGAAATTAARTRPRTRVATRVRAVAAGLAVLGTAFGVLVEGSHAPVSVSPHVLLPYLLAAAGAWVWTLPPRVQVSPPVPG